VNSPAPDNCIFCAIAGGRAPAVVVYEDARTLAFLDIHPSARGHTLVIPKAHYDSLYDVQDGDGIVETLARVARGLRDALQPEGLNVMQANGRAAGQTVSHLHFHLIPRWSGDALPVPRHPSRVTDYAELETIAAQIQAHMQPTQE
jgi:histidine triad (HIT) family protein